MPKKLLIIITSFLLTIALLHVGGSFSIQSQKTTASIQTASSGELFLRSNFVPQTSTPTVTTAATPTPTTKKEIIVVPPTQTPTPTTTPVPTQPPTPSPMPTIIYLPTPLPIITLIPRSTNTSTPTLSATPTITPTPAPTTEHIFYTSSHWRSKYYYCDTDKDWEKLSKKYLKQFDTTKTLLEEYDRVEHEPCK